MTRRPHALRGPAPAAGPPPWYRIGPIVALAPDDTGPAGDDSTEDAAASSADVYVYDTIGGWLGLTADDFVRDVASLDVDQIVLHLNSPGGDAMEGVAIANVLRAHRARIVVRVDGMAASAASVIAMAGDEVVMGIGSQMMVHDPWGYAIGNEAELTQYVRRLTATGDSLASTYAARAGGTTESWRAVMRAESWYTADEAVTAGLADRVAAADETGTAQGEQVTPGGSYSWWDLWDSLRDQNRFDLAAFGYTYAGRSDAPAPAMPGRAPAAHAGGPHPTKQKERGGDVAFSDGQLTTMRQRLGLADDADETTIVSALCEALDEQAGPAPALPAGVVAIDATQLADLQAAATAGRTALTRQETDDRQRLVSAAIHDGRIPKAREEHWLNLLTKDPDAAATLAGLAKGLVPVEPVGYTGDGGESDDLYESVFGKEG